jgi:glucosamine--fructose-6-phosphate aminotransferase (isomerizing)|tara:strand:+ start:96 stop:725 length:630 start_codon:yes stop_codon:yes gene_type:complete
MLEVLYDANKERGNFASSVVCLSDDDQYIAKYEGDINFDKFNYAGRKDIEYLLGHVQAPTSAKRTWNYNTSHPFESMTWLVSHNGVLTNEKKLRRKHTRFLENPVDTAVIVELLEKYSQVNKTPINTIKQVLSMLEGSFALSVVNCETNDVFIARVGSVLHYNNKGNYTTMPGTGYKVLPEGVIMKLNKKTKRWNKAGTFEVKSPFTFV